MACVTLCVVFLKIPWMISPKQTRKKYIEDFFIIFDVSSKSLECSVSVQLAVRELKSLDYTDVARRLSFF
jgi:hypothetical protein